MTSVLTELIALLAPPGCLACRAPLAGAERRLCVACARGMPWLEPGCPRCALPAHRGGVCPAAALAFERAWAPLAFAGPARALVHALKFRGALPAAQLMAAQMAANLPADLRAPLVGLAETAASRPVPLVGLPEVAASRPVPLVGLPEVAARRPAPLVGLPDCRGDQPAPWAPTLAIVPAPTVARRRRARGFDPAVVLAGALARRLERPLADCLRRRDRAPSQIGRGRSARRAGGRRIELALRRAPPPCALLVDDVHTTGATLDAATRALAAAGCRVVAAISYARTL